LRRRLPRLRRRPSMARWQQNPATCTFAFCEPVGSTPDPRLMGRRLSRSVRHTGNHTRRTHCPPRRSRVPPVAYGNGRGSDTTDELDRLHAARVPLGVLEHYLHGRRVFEQVRGSERLSEHRLQEALLALCTLRIILQVFTLKVHERLVAVYRLPPWRQGYPFSAGHRPFIARGTLIRTPPIDPTISLIPSVLTTQ
jgi:hypothetical protein